MESSGCFADYSYFALINGLEREDCDAYFASIKDAQPGLELLSTSTDPIRLSLLFPIYYQKEIQAYIVIELDEDELLRSIDLEEGMYFAVMFGDTVVAESGEASTRGTSTSLDSSFDGLSYVIVSDESVYSGELKLAILLTVAGIVICIGIALLASYKITKRNATPLLSILDSLGYGNERDLALVNKKIDAMLKDQEANINRIEIQRGLLDGAFLEEVIVRNLNDEVELGIACGKYKMDCDFPFFVLTCVQGGEVDDLKRFSPMSAKVGLYQAFLFPLEEEVVLGSLIDALTTLGRDHKVGLGQVYDTLKSVTLSWSQAVEAASSCDPAGFSRYVGSLDPTTKCPDQDSLVNFMAELGMERFSEASHYLDGALDVLLDHKESTDLRRCKVKGIVDDLRPYADVSALCYASEKVLRDGLANILSSLAQEPATTQEGRSDEICVRALKLIEENYADSQFGLYQLAQLLGVNNSYLSTRFKQYYGIGVARCIQGLRIAKAKNLILTTGMSIREIALSVGFSSDIAFFKAFKKVEMVTPSTMRKNRGRYGSGA